MNEYWSTMFAQMEHGIEFALFCNDVSMERNYSRNDLHFISNYVAKNFSDMGSVAFYIGPSRDLGNII